MTDTRRYRVHVLDFTNEKEFVEEGQVTPDCKCPSDMAITTRKPVIYRKRDLETLAIESEITQRLLDRRRPARSALFRLLSHDKVFGTLNVRRSHEDGFTPDESELLSQVAQQIAIAVENGLAYREIADLKDKLHKEKLYLEDEIRTEYNFEEIVGDSAVAEARAQTSRDRRADGFHGARPGRNRHREGTDCPRHS